MVGTIGHGVHGDAVEESGKSEGEVQIEVARQPRPATDMEDGSKVAAVGDEHVAGDLMPEGVPVTANRVGFRERAVKGWPVL